MSHSNQGDKGIVVCCMLLSLSPSRQADWCLQPTICHSLMTSLESPPLSALSIIALCSYIPSDAAFFSFLVTAVVCRWLAFCLVVKERKRNWVDMTYWWFIVIRRDTVARKENEAAASGFGPRRLSMDVYMVPLVLVRLEAMNLSESW